MDTFFLFTASYCNKGTSKLTLLSLQTPYNCTVYLNWMAFLMYPLATRGLSGKKDSLMTITETDTVQSIRLNKHLNAYSKKTS